MWPFCCCSVTKLWSTLCEPMDCITPGIPVLHYLLELAQTHVRWVDDAIQPSYPLLSPSSPALPSIFLTLRVFSNELALCIRWWKYWNFSISPSSEYSGLISFRMDWFDLLAVQGTLKSSSPASSPFLPLIIWFSFRVFHVIVILSVLNKQKMGVDF